LPQATPTTVSCETEKALAGIYRGSIEGESSEALERAVEVFAASRVRRPAAALQGPHAKFHVKRIFGFRFSEHSFIWAATGIISTACILSTAPRCWRFRRS